MSGERSGRLLLAGSLRPGRVRFEGGSITAVEELSSEGDPAALPIVAPGLLDLHVHGFGGCEAADGLAGMARALARAGTTAFLPTLFPRPAEELGRDAERVWEEARRLPTGSARALGLHLEGPFVNPGAAGALPRGGLVEPSPGALAALLGPATGGGRGVRAMTLAPELPGATELVAELVRSGVRVSLGHSLARAAEARAAVEVGARGVTHLYNAMRPLHHREAGLCGIALTMDELFVEVIGDLVHVGPEALTLARRARGARGLCLVSDALCGAACGRTRFTSHGHTCLAENGAAWFEDPTAEGGRRLAGSTTGQLAAVQRLVRRGVLPPEEALTMASESPARALDLEHELGRLEVGARADLLVLRAHDLELVEVLLGGDPIALEPPARE